MYIWSLFLGTTGNKIIAKTTVMLKSPRYIILYDLMSSSKPTTNPCIAGAAPGIQSNYTLLNFKIYNSNSRETTFSTSYDVSL